MNGTVAPYVYKQLEKRNIEIIIWDRSKVDTESQKSVSDFIRTTQPDLFFHIATGPVKWLEFIAKATKELSVKLLFTSSVSVFSEKEAVHMIRRVCPMRKKTTADTRFSAKKLQEPGTGLHHPQTGWQIGSEEGSQSHGGFPGKGPEGKWLH